MRNHKKKAGQMFSCTGVSGWERHVAVALAEGEHWGKFAPSVCFGAKMLLWDNFLSRDTVGTRLEAWKSPITHRIAFFP